MRFQKKTKIEKTILVISDLHLGAGKIFNGRQNCLEDFHHDKELVEFIEYYSIKEYDGREVELIINGDFFDFLAVPFVQYFDDEFWSEDAALAKLKIILKAHSEVVNAFNLFLKNKNKKITYIIGNHDVELLFEGVRNYFLQTLSKESAARFKFYTKDDYTPCDGVLVRHGHEYEPACHVNVENCIIKSSDGKKYLTPPWGSYYVIKLINKFKEERNYINQLFPIRNFIIYGLIFDTLFVLRLIFSHIHYFIMVRYLVIYQMNNSWKHIINKIMLDIKDIKLFKSSSNLTEYFLEFDKRNIKAMILGHTHCAFLYSNENSSLLVNTGTWTRMVNLDFSRNQSEINLTYCQIDVSKKNNFDSNNFEHINVVLNSWKGKQELPYVNID